MNCFFTVWFRNNALTLTLGKYAQKRKLKKKMLQYYAAPSTIVQCTVQCRYMYILHCTRQKPITEVNQKRLVLLIHTVHTHVQGIPNECMNHYQASLKTRSPPARETKTSPHGHGLDWHGGGGEAVLTFTSSTRPKPPTPSVAIT